jgi:flagella basal body P-ring formation protein FlgA
MVLRLPERLEVTRASAVLESSAQRDAVEAAVRSHLGQVDTLASVKVPSLPDLQIPAGATLGVSVDRAPKGGRTVSTTLRVLDGQVAIRTQQVVVQIDPLTQTWVLRGDIGRGQPVTSGDLVSVMRPASEQPADAIRDPAELIAATARRDLTGGEALVRRALEVQPMVPRGQRVTMVAIGRGIRVSAVGEALAAGRQGDTIRIKNLDSNKVVTGRVSGPQTVQLEL